MSCSLRQNNIAITVSDYTDEPSKEYKLNRSESLEDGTESRGEVEMPDMRGYAASLQRSKDSGVGNSKYDSTDTLSLYSCNSCGIPSTPSTRRAQSTIPSHISHNADRPQSLDVGQFLAVPPSGPFSNSSPRSLRRAVSECCLDGMRSQAFDAASLCSAASSISSWHFQNTTGTACPGDSVSGANIPARNTEMSEEMKKRYLKRTLSRLLSGVYAVFLLMFGAILYLSELRETRRIITEVFSTLIAIIGMMWLLVLHVDLCKYKRDVLKQLKEREDAMQELGDRISTATEVIINSGYAMAADNSSTTHGDKRAPPYRFLIGRHSGSFYLKIGMAAFCFGNLIYEGLQLGQHVLNFVDDEKKENCSRASSVVLHIILPLYAFYQLYITFKYSNVVINRNKAIAKVGLMHLIATCLCFWLNTIIEEAVLDYHHKSTNGTLNGTTTEFDVANYHFTVERKGNWVNPYHCMADSVLSTRSMEAIPYLYPFAIEYNLLLAGVWFIMWQNIGQGHQPSNPHHIRHTISQDETGLGGNINYQSNLVISADCHASNKGLFIGMFLLLTTIVTVIVFFVAMTTKGYQDRAVIVHTGQEGILTLIGLVATIVAYVQLNKLDINRHPITFLDDVLMFVPLPFYFIHGLMSISAEYASGSNAKLAMHVLVTLEVVVQTVFILDGLRRCSNSQLLRYRKPGREVVTFLIILNLALWIVNTFELKSVERYHGQEEYYGDFLWMFVGHTTLPVMLFYRFHSSVCLADMWKSAYEKES